MPNYLLYREDIETIEPDEAETHSKIIDVMTKGQNITREKYGKAVRISHAKAHGVLKGQLVIKSGLPSELAQGLFSQPGTHPALVRMAAAPGEYTDDSKLSTSRGMSVKVFDVKGPKLEGHIADTQDWVFDSSPEFFVGGAKAFLQAFKPNAEIAPKLSDNVKGAVSTVSRVTNQALDAVGLKSDKLGFYGHPIKHPLTEPYYSQTAYRYGDYVAKLGFFPDTPGLKELIDQEFDPETPDAFRDAMNAFFRTHPAEFSLRVQLNTGLDSMPIEDAQAKWAEDDSQYQEVARLILPMQTAWDPARDEFVEPLSFSPDHGLEAHRPLGSINRARRAAYAALSTLRRRENNQPIAEITSAEALLADD